MDLQALSTLLLVARQGSFAAAARALDQDPSSVSRTISALEEELNLRLFERSTRRLAITPAGARYIARIEPLVEGLKVAQEDATASEADVAGLVRLTASVAFGNEVIVPLLLDLRVALPGIELELILSDDPVDLVGGGVDLAIRLAPAPSGDLISARLMHTRYHAVAAPDFLQWSADITQPRDLQGQACLRYALPGLRDAWTFRRDGETEQVPVTGPIAISNALALRESARAGLGIALLADWLVKEDLAAGRLVRILPEYEATLTDFDTGAWLLYPSRRYLPARTRAVIDFLRARL